MTDAQINAMLVFRAYRDAIGLCGFIITLGVIAVFYLWDNIK